MMKTTGLVLLLSLGCANALNMQPSSIMELGKEVGAKDFHEEIEDDEDPEDPILYNADPALGSNDEDDLLAAFLEDDEALRVHDSSNATGKIPSGYETNFPSLKKLKKYKKKQTAKVRKEAQKACKAMTTDVIFGLCEVIEGMITPYAAGAVYGLKEEQIYGEYFMKMSKKKRAMWKVMEIMVKGGRRRRKKVEWLAVTSRFNEEGVKTQSEALGLPPAFVEVEGEMHDSGRHWDAVKAPKMPKEKDLDSIIKCGRVSTLLNGICKSCLTDIIAGALLCSSGMEFDYIPPLVASGVFPGPIHSMDEVESTWTYELPLNPEAAILHGVHACEGGSSELMPRIRMFDGNSTSLLPVDPLDKNDPCLSDMLMPFVEDERKFTFRAKKCAKAMLKGWKSVMNDKLGILPAKIKGKLSLMQKEKEDVDQKDCIGKCRQNDVEIVFEEADADIEWAFMEASNSVYMVCGHGALGLLPAGIQAFRK